LNSTASGVGGSRHAGELLVHPEVVLKGDRGESLVLPLYLDVFLRFEGLVEPFAVTPAGHKPARELIDDDNLTVLYDVIDVAGEELMCLQGLVDVMEEIDVIRVVEVFDIEDLLQLCDALFGKIGAARLLVYHEILITLELGYQFVDLVILVCRLFRRAGDDERGSRLVNEDAVDFIDDCIVELALDAILKVIVHVVAQIVETELVVRAVRYVAGVSMLPGDIIEVVDYDTHGKAEELIHRTHPFGIPFGEVIVDGHHVDAEAAQGVEVYGKGGDECLPFTGRHFGDLAFMQDDAADELDVEMTHSQGACGGFPDDGKGLGQNGIKLLTIGDSLLEVRCHRLEFLVTQGSHPVFKFVGPLDHGLYTLELTLVLGSDNLLD